MSEDIGSYAISKALELGASYADVRIESQYMESISTTSGMVDRALASRKRGLGIRVLADGAWGFRSTTGLTRDAVMEAVQLSVRCAKASAKHAAFPISLAQAKAYQDSVKVDAKMDVEEYPLEQKISDVLMWERALKSSKYAKRRTVEYAAIKSEKLFMSSEGAKILFESTVLWAEPRAYAARAGKLQYYDQIVGGSGGYEMLKNSDMESVCGRIGDKATSLLRAKAAKEERGVVVVLDPSYVQLVSHEICGHPSEGDRVLGREAAWAGTSWWADKLGKRIGSEQMNVYDDSTIPGTMGYYLYDDEGVKAQRKPLVEHGIVKGFMHSRETAAAFGVEPNGGMRALSYEYVPLIRMSNTFFAPGDWTVEEMMEGVKHGYLVSAMRHPSIDDKRYNWTISAHEAYEIVNGEPKGHVCDVALTSTAPEFFSSIDAASKQHQIFPLPGCGKGDPMQGICVGNGGPYIRARADILGLR